jgi:transcriptional regulator with XRE-family HTH domain
MNAPRNIVGHQVMLIRNKRGWFQQKLASVCQIQGWDISRGVVARIEGGDRWIADFEVLHLATALEVPVPELYPKKNRGAFFHSLKHRRKSGSSLQTSCFSSKGK